MSADFLSDKELSSLLKLAAAAIDNDDLSVEQGADLVDALDMTAEALDARRGIGDAGKPAALDMERSATVDQVKADALALDYSGRMAILRAIQDATGQVDCVSLSVQDIMDEARASLADPDDQEEEGDEGAAPLVTLEMALDVCREVSEGDWTSTYDEASWRAKRRLMERAREAAQPEESTGAEIKAAHAADLKD